MKLLAGERLLRGNAKDYKMTPCRGHTDYITKMGLIDSKIVSLSNNGQIINWVGENYEIVNFNPFEVRNFLIIPEGICIVSGTGDVQVLDRMFSCVLSKNIGLKHIRMCYHKKWIYFIGYKDREVFGTALAIDHEESFEINYSLLAIPGRIVSNNIAFNGNRLYSGFENSIIVWNTKAFKIENENILNNTVCDFFSVREYVIGFWLNNIALWDDKGNKVKNIMFYGYPILSGVHSFMDRFVGYFGEGANLRFIDPLNFQNISRIMLGDTNATCVSFNSYIVAVGTANASVHIFDWKSGERKYLLLLGSMNPSTVPKSFVFHPVKQGCSDVVIDDDRIIASIGNLIRVYQFDLN